MDKKVVISVETGKVEIEVKDVSVSRESNTVAPMCRPGAGTFTRWEDLYQDDTLKAEYSSPTADGDRFRSRIIESNTDLWIRGGMFSPQAWLDDEHNHPEASVPDFYPNIACSTQVSMVFIYPEAIRAEARVPMLVEFGSARPIVTFRTIPSENTYREKSEFTRAKLDSQEPMTVILRPTSSGGGIAHCHVHISDKPENVKGIIFALAHDPAGFLCDVQDRIARKQIPVVAHVVGDAEDPKKVQLTLQPTKNLTSMRFLLQVGSTRLYRLGGPRIGPPVDTMPSCTMFTGTYETDRDWNVTVTPDTFWAADWPAPVPPPT